MLDWEENRRKNVLDLLRYPMVKWRAPGGIRGRNLLLKCGCRDRCISWSRRLFSCHNPTKNATLFTAYHTNRCQVYRKDLQHPWTRANIPHTFREASGENNLWNLWLWERTGCFPLAMAVALVRKSAHNAYQLRLPAILWLKMEAGQRGRMGAEKREHHLCGNWSSQGNPHSSHAGLLEYEAGRNHDWE